MIILRCTGEWAETTFWQFHHALLHSGSSQNWHRCLWSKPKQGCDILKEVFQMISVTESIVFEHWQCFKGHYVCACLCVRTATEREWALAHARWRWVAHVDICNFNDIQVKNTLCDAQHLVLRCCHCISPPPPSCINPPSIRAHNEIKWLSTLMCIFHHACLFFVFFVFFCTPSMMNLSCALVEALSAGSTASLTDWWQTVAVTPWE